MMRMENAGHHAGDGCYYAVLATTMVAWRGCSLAEFLLPINAFFKTLPNRSETSLTRSQLCLLAECNRSLVMTSAAMVALAIDSRLYPRFKSLSLLL
jgi:hypothetical protein